MKHIPSTLLLVLFGFTNGQKEIPYRQLSWEDFKGKPDYTTPSIARTTWEWEYTFTEDDGVFTFSVKCYFVPSESWTKTRSPYVLSHEQLHFQLAESHCRQLQKAFTAINGCRNCKDAVDSMYALAYRQTCTAQITYDSCTHHGENKVSQAEWNLKIANDIKQ